LTKHYSILEHLNRFAIHARTLAFNQFLACFLEKM
jgi:hypothetical protein